MGSYIVAPEFSAKGESVGCLLALMSAFAPRLVLFVIWIARPVYIDRVFDTFIFPLIGLIFLPFTTLMWVLLAAPPAGVHGFDWLWIGTAVILDLGHYGGAYEHRSAFGGSTRAA